MILDNELYRDCSVWTKISCVCDYCGTNFVRTKRNIKVGRAIIDKESCNSKECAKKKRCESQLLKYGVENAGGTQASIEKAKATWRSNLGVDNPMQLDEVKEKIRQTCMLRYGKGSYLETDLCKQSLKEFSMDRYGVENISQAEEIKHKIKQTCYTRYGVSHPRKYEKYMQEFCKVFLEKHGVAFPSQMIDHLEKRQKTCLEKYGADHPVKNQLIQDKIRETCIEKYGKYPVNCFGKTEKDIKSFVQQLGHECKSDRKILEGKEIDIYASKDKIGIEYCGLFWHNEMSPTPRNRNYHFDKFNLLRQKGIRLLTIFEDEWIYKRPICESVIASIFGVYSNRFYARNCCVEQIDVNEAKVFLDENHMQSATRFQFCCGLLHKGKLVACATYGKHHRQNQNGIVISRFCSAKGTQVVGGISKMFKFIKSQVPNEKIITWSDNRWSQGDIYKKLGFCLDQELPPDYSYYKYGSLADRRSKQSMKKSNTGCPKNKTEKDWCLENGYVRIWDCGKKRWVLE